MFEYIYIINYIAFFLFLIGHHINNRWLIITTNGLFLISFIMIIFILCKSNKKLRKSDIYRCIIQVILNITFFTLYFSGKV